MAQIQQVGKLMVVGVPLARRRDDDHTALRVGFDYRLDLFELFGSRDGGAAEFCNLHSYSSTAAKNISAPFSLCFAANACMDATLTGSVITLATPFSFFADLTGISETSFSGRRT